MEEAGGKLYVYTCHEMYADSDGINHQANMLFTIDESYMSQTHSMYDVSNLTDGYVSHSFNQFIKADESGKYIYRVDHSESSNYTMNGSYLSVNGITLTKYKADGIATAVCVAIPVKFDMNKSNYTGASIGGFELGSGNCLIAYAKDVSSSCKTRNVYISVTDELFNGTQNIALTNYGTSSKVTCRTPQLIKINDNLFLVMWEEYNSSTGKTVTKTMTVDSNGKTVTKAISHSFVLSDCQPVVCSDGMVKWYVTNNSAPTLYKLSPFALDDYHEHSYTKTVLSNATCTTAGTVKYTCSCGDSYTETIPATGHKSSGWIVDKAASIGVKGSKHKECTVCKKVLETAEIPALSRISISKASVTLSTSTYAYDDKAKTPSVTVKVGGKTLKKDTDYTVSYSNNTKVGTAKVTITGKGNYTGSVSKTYSIKNNFKKATISGISNKSYTGKNITQSITVKYNGKTLKKGTDYTVSYSSNKNIGTATVKIAGKGSYTGTITKTFKINPAKQEIQKLTAKSKAFFVDWAQKGSATGYEIQYATNSKFTSAKKVTITNKKTDTKTVSKLSGKKKYYVRVRSYTNVNGKVYYGAWSDIKSIKTANNDITKATVSGISTKAFTGKAITQNVTVKVGNTVLKNGTDYTVSYSNNKNVGKATVKITGKGKYGGVITKTFKINPAKQEIQKLTAKSKAFFVDWAQKGSATGYEIQYATNSKFTGAKKVTITNNKTDKTTVSKLSANKKYYVRVRSYTTVGGTKYYGAWSAVKNVTTKK